MMRRVAEGRAEIAREREAAQQCAAFLRQGSGRLLSDAEVAHLVKQAEGWVAGLRLPLAAAASKKPRPDDDLDHMQSR